MRDANKPTRPVPLDLTAFERLTLTVSASMWGTLAAGFVYLAWEYSQPGILLGSVLAGSWGWPVGVAAFTGQSNTAAVEDLEGE